jgi:vesicle coat complex subunit
MAVNRIKGAFQVPRKGETFELRAGLVSQYAYERKESIQKTIMAMTLGKDVSALFPDVLKNIATGDLDQKKLVYLYLMYASCAWAVLGAPQAREELILTVPGTMQSRIPTSAFLPSTPLSRTQKTRTH